MSAKVGIKICGTHRQCHRLYAGIVQIVGYVKAEFGAHGGHGGNSSTALGLARS